MKFVGNAVKLADTVVKLAVNVVKLAVNVVKLAVNVVKLARDVVKLAGKSVVVRVAFSVTVGIPVENVVKLFVMNVTVGNAPTELFASETLVTFAYWQWHALTVSRASTAMPLRRRRNIVGQWG